MEKPQLINFIAKVMEDSGFNIQKNFRTSQSIIDIYATLPTTIGDFRVVVDCENYEKNYEVGVELLKEVENVAKSVKASKITIVVSSFFSNQAIVYARRKKIKLVDREALTKMAQRYQNKTRQTTLDNNFDGNTQNYVTVDEYNDYMYDEYDMDYLMHKRNSDPVVYNSNSLYRQNDQPQSRFSFLDNRNNHGRDYYQPAPPNYDYPQRNLNLMPVVFELLRNPVIDIVVVVILSYLISYIFSSLLNFDAGMAGLVEMIVAIILSYGISLITEKDSYFIVKGTFIFFISLIFLIILIFI